VLAVLPLFAGLSFIVVATFFNRDPLSKGLYGKVLTAAALWLVRADRLTVHGVSCWCRGCCSHTVVSGSA
jgi:hypothetical protein